VKKDPKTGELVQEEPTYGSWDFGHTTFLQALSKKLVVTAELKSAFPSLWTEVLTLAFFKLAEGKPLYLCSHWLIFTIVGTIFCIGDRKCTICCSVSCIVTSISTAEQN
jgi:hypothetical protein